MFGSEELLDRLRLGGRFPLISSFSSSSSLELESESEEENEEFRSLQG